MSRGAAAGVRPQWLIDSEGVVNLRVVAKPGSSRSGILGRDPRGLIIGLNSRPSKGQANDELVTFLADLMGTPRASVVIVRGQTARMKTVRIANPQSSQVAALLRDYA